MSLDSYFLAVLQSSLKISRKNSLLKQRAITLKNAKAFLNNHEVPMTNPSIINIGSSFSSIGTLIDEIFENPETFPIIEFCILSGSDKKNFMSDLRFIEMDKRLIESEIENWSHEELFEAGKLMCFRKNFGMSLEFLKKAQVLQIERVDYKLWKLMLKILVAQNVREKKEESTGCCCNSRHDVGVKNALKKCCRKLERFSSNVEAIWLLLMVSVSGQLVEGVDIEPSRFYAKQLKDLSDFYGYLAWSVIYMRENDPSAGPLLLELIANYSKRPEPYYLCWSFYKHLKDYEKCLEIASEAFLKITSDDFDHFYILFCMKLAKSYYLTGKFTNSIDLLHKKFLEHPQYPVFLFYLGKFCVLSEDFAFSGIGKGTLRELLRVSDYSRKGKLYFWLVKAYLFTRQLPEVFKYAVKAMKTLDNNNKLKFKEVRQIYLGLQGFMHVVLEIQQNIKNRRLSEALEKCQIVSEMHKPTADLLCSEIRFLMGDRHEAVNNLRAMISSSRLEIAAYFKLIEFEPLNKENIFKSLLARVQSNQMPIQTWVKVNLAYSKLLFENRLYNKCFFTLRLFSRFIPPFASLKLPYITQLKSQKNLKDFSGLVSPSESHSNPFKPFQNPNIDQKSFSGRKIKPNPKFKEFCAFKRLSIQTELDEESSIPLSTITSPRRGQTSNFSLCSKGKFLYYISKFSLKLNKNHEEALLAIKDYKELTSLTQNSQKYQKMMKKAEELEKRLESFFT
jgi:tetratricopeptide (TPR) repeat protein